MLNKFALLFLITIITIHSLVLTKIIFFPYPELFVYPYLTNHGLKPYQQILDQHFPGLLFLPINFDNLGLTNEIIAREWSIGIIILTHILIFFVLTKLLKNYKKALLGNILYLIWHPIFEGWILWIDSFLPLLLLPAFYFSYNKKLFLSGLLLGIGIVFKQTLIPLVLLLWIYLIWEYKNIRKTLALLFGVFIPIGLMFLYLMSIGVIKDFWYWTILFNLTEYASNGLTTFISKGFILRLLLVYSFSIFVLFIENKRLTRIIFVFLLGSLVGAFDRVEFIHFQPSLPFAILAGSLGVYRFYKNKLFLIALVIYFGTAFWWLNVFYKGHTSNKVFFFDEQTKAIAAKIQTLSAPSDKIFIYGAPNNLYSMSKRLPSGNIFVFQFPWFLKVAEDRILDGLIKDFPKIIVYDSGYKVEGETLKDFSPKIYNYIETNYEKLDNIGTTKILQRNQKK